MIDQTRYSTTPMSQPSSSLVAMRPVGQRQAERHRHADGGGNQQPRMQPRDADRHSWVERQSCGAIGCSSLRPPLGDEAGGGAQSIGLRAERRQRGIGLARSVRRAGRARRRRPSAATSVALPAAASLPAALPMVAASPSSVEQVVGDLERLADRRAIAVDAARARRHRLVRGWRRRGRRSGSARRSSSPAR